MSDPADLRADPDTPDPRRLSPENAQYTRILELHAAALQSGLPTYRDPLSGFSVFTSRFLAKRGTCCNSGCRHCPYLGHTS